MTLRRRGAWSWLGLALVALTVLVAPPARAAGSFSATIVGMDPALPTAGGDITVELQLANSTTSPVAGISAQFMVSTAPLRGRSEIPDIAAGRSLPTYRLLEGEVASGLDLPSGASTTITVRTTARALGLASGSPGAYLFGIEVSGTDGGGRPVQARPVTLLPWLPSAPEGGLGVATFWTLTAPPARAADGSFLNAQLAQDVLPGGRLRLQLDAMRRVAGATWLVDPLLVESLRAIAGGARIRPASGDIRAASDAEMAAAGTWLDDLSTAVATGTLAALPLGDFDVRAALKLGRVTVARHALSGAAQRLATAMQRPVVPLIVPLYGGSVPGSTWRLLNELGASVVVAPDSGYPAEQTAYTPTTGFSVPSFSRTALVSDQTTSATPISSGLTPVQARQAFAAHLLMTYLERPNDFRAITVIIPPSWVPENGISCADVLNARWIRRLDPAAAAAAGTASRGQQQAGASASQRRQSARTTEPVTEQRMLRLLTTDAAFSTQVDDLVSGILSRWWTGRLDGADYALDVQDELSSLAGSVRVVTRGDIVFGGERGKVPVTVANGLPVPVAVLLRATGIPPARVQARATTVIHLNAGKRVSVEIPTRVTGSGDAFLLLEVLADDLTPIGMPALLTVRSAAYARVAGYLVAVAFAALLLLIAVNTVRRVRLRRLGLVEDE